MQMKKKDEFCRRLPRGETSDGIDAFANRKQTYHFVRHDFSHLFQDYTLFQFKMLNVATLEKKISVMIFPPCLRKPSAEHAPPLRFPLINVCT